MLCCASCVMRASAVVFRGLTRRNSGAGGGAALQYGGGGGCPVAALPKGDERLRHRILHRKGGEGVPGEGELFAVPQEGAQHPVYIPGGGGDLHLAGLLYRLIDGGAFRDGGHIQKLIYRHPQDIPHGGGELFHRLAGIASQYPVQRDAPFHHAVKQRGAEGALLPGELVISHQALQHQVGVAALPEHLREAPQGGHSCIGHGLIPVPSPADDDQP